MYLLQHVRREVGCQRIITRQHCASGWRATYLVSEFSSFPPSLLSLFLLYHLSLFLSFCLSPCTSRWQSGGLQCMSTCECEAKSRAGGLWVGLFMRRGEHVATGLNASRGPWQTTGPPVLSALCLDKGPPILLSKGPKHLLLRVRQERLFGQGDVHVHSPPLTFPLTFYACRLTSSATWISSLI